MTSLHNKNHTLLIGQESTFGTPVTADKDIGLVQSFSPTDTRTINKARSSGSREIQDLIAEKSVHTFDAEVLVNNGRIFEYLFGSVSHAETTGDWVHTFDVADTIPSFTLESSFNSTTDAVFIYQGCKLGSGTVALETNGKLKTSVSGISQAPDTSTVSASAPSISDLQILHYKNAIFKTGTAGAETKVGKLQTFNFNLDNGLIEVDDAGTFTVQELVEGDLEMTFDFTMTFENLTEYNLFLGGTSPQLQPTKQSAVFNLNNGVTIGSGRREFNLQLNNFLYEEASAPTTVGELVIATFKGTAEGLGTDKCFYTDNISDVNFS